ARPSGPAALAGPVPRLQRLDRGVLPPQPGAPQVRGDAAGARRAPRLPRAGARGARAGRGRVVHPPQPGERALLALQLLGPALHVARGARRDVGLPRGHRGVELAHERALRREPLLSPRGQPLDRDAAGPDRHDRGRGVRVPPEAARRLPGGAELVGARAALAHRVGLPAIPRLARALPLADPARVLPPQLLGRGGGERAGDRGDRGADRGRPDVRLHRLPALRLQLPQRVGHRAQALLARGRGPEPDGRSASLRLRRRRFRAVGRGGGRLGRAGGRGRGQARRPGRRVSEIQHRVVETNGIRLHVAEQGEGPLVLLCHGFPESWYSWRHQLRALADAGLRAVAPDMRGYGQSEAPAEIERYTLLHLVGDMVGLLDALGAPTAVIAGHDWGAPVAWH